MNKTSLTIRQRIRRMSLLVLITAGVGYLAVVAVVFCVQDRLVYHPERSLMCFPAPHTYEEVALKTSDGLTLHGWFIPPARPDGPVLLFCHGNGGNISYHLDLVAVTRPWGTGVLLFDYRGYGRSEGAPSETGTYRDADAAWAYLTRDKHVAPSRIVIFGWSLGGAIAAELAAKVKSAGLILEDTFTSLPDRGQELFWFLPVRLLARIRYPTIDYLAKVDCPLLVIHSRDDQIVPFHHGQRLFDAAREPKRFVEISGDHNSGALGAGPVYTEALRQFIADCVPLPHAAGPASREAPASAPDGEPRDE